MTYPFPPDVAQLVQQQMATGHYRSEDDVLRDALSALEQFIHTQEAAQQEFEDTVAAVREGVADMEAGRMTPLRKMIIDAKGGIGGHA